VDKLEMFVAPRLLGDGKAWLAMPGLGLDESPRFQLEQTKEIGPDLWLSYRPST
jgi:riboflavin biosynthesis pyrimidine reductase